MAPSAGTVSGKFEAILWRNECVCLPVSVLGQLGQLGLGANNTL